MPDGSEQTLLFIGPQHLKSRRWKIRTIILLAQLHERITDREIMQSCKSAKSDSYLSIGAK